MPEPTQKQTKGNGEIHFSLVPVSRMPTVIRNRGKYQKIVEAARNLKLAATADTDPSIRIPLGTTEKANRNAAVTLGNHVKNFPDNIRIQSRNGTTYEMRVSTRTEGKEVAAYIYLDEQSKEA